MKAVITVIGKDTVGIIAKVSKVLAECNSNILDISQTTMDNLFTMIMYVDNAEINIPYNELSDQLTEAGLKMGLEIRMQREDIFHSMHSI